jgi:gliding motility-associated-like protein
MKAFRKIFFVLICLLPAFAYSQTEKVTRYGEFSSVHQDIWGQGGGFSLNMSKELFRLQWDKSGKSGGISTLAGMKFGGEIDASTWGDIGSNFILNGFTSGLANVYYPFNVEYTFPDSATYNVGDKVRISTKYDVLPNCSLKVDNPSTGVAELRMHFGFGFDVATKLCLFGCTDFHIIPDINLPVQDFYLIHIDSSGLICPCASSNYICSDYDDPSTCTKLLYNTGLPGYCKIKTFPYKIPVAGGAITGTVSLPYDGLTNSYQLKGKSLYASGQYNYMTINTDLFQTLSLIPIPVVSTVLGNLSNDYSVAGYGKFSYNIFDMDFPLKNYHKHEFSFEPTLYNKIRLSTKVDYEIFDDHGQSLGSGNDSIINYPLESDIEIKIPCNSAFVDVLNHDYDIASTKNFRNHTYDSLSFEIAMSALAFSITLPKVVVVPKICFPEICIKIPYPCPTWRKPWKWCSKTKCTPAFCTPEIKFNGFYFGVGPLWEYNKQLASTKFDWYDNQWEFGGFSPYVDTNRIYRLYPANYDVQLTKTDVLCYGASTGRIRAEIQGGTKPYNIEWSNGSQHYVSQSVDSIMNLPAGFYHIKITDQNNCELYSAIEIKQPELPIQTSFVNITDVKCFGDQSGAIDLAVSGGNGAFTFAWTSNQATFHASTEDIQNIAYGEYYVEVSDKYGCKAYDTAEVIQPNTALGNSIKSSDVLCFGDLSGSAEAIPSGGTPPYSYAWSTTDTLKKIELLGAGTYQLVVTDAHACSYNDQVIITQPQKALTLAISALDLSCFNSQNGQIDLDVSGGTKPYSYSWADANNVLMTNTSEDLQQLEAGTYTAMVTDANECMDSISVVVREPAEITTQISAMDVKCHAGNDGAAIMKVQGGSTPYTFVWSDGSANKDLTAVSAGYYVVDVYDSANCHTRDSVYIDQPDQAITPSITAEHVSCFGDASGKIDLDVIGGTPPYRYAWSNGDTLSHLAQLTSGLYTVDITDANGCLAYSGQFIEQPDAPLDFVAGVQHVSCMGESDAHIEINASGGTAPYYFRWNDSLLLLNNSSELLQNLSAGHYHIEVKDEKGCSAEKDYLIREPDALSLSYQTSKVSCFEGQDGEIDISLTGGTQPYQYYWNTGVTSEDLQMIPSGEYYVQVVDSHGCDIEQMIFVDQFPEMELDAEISDISCSDQSDGHILVRISGGAGNYSYQWSTGDSTKNLFRQQAGIYWLEVSDQNNCHQRFEHLEIEFNESVCINIPSSFTPNGDGMNDSWILRNIELYPDAVIKVFNRWGNLVFESKGAYTAWDGKFNGNDLPAATYYYVIDLHDDEAPYTGNLTIVR